MKDLVFDATIPPFHHFPSRVLLGCRPVVDPSPAYRGICSSQSRDVTELFLSSNMSLARHTDRRLI
jgi:hypothetical protein